jgi:Putative zinc-binding metallo-peptidase
MPSPLKEGRLLFTRIRDLGLKIEGTPLETVLAQFQEEIEAKGIRRWKPSFYLSDEWGVPFGSISIAIPFYLAKPELKEVHAERTAYLEGEGRTDLLRYLRHEMGHAVNYAYRLYEQEEWTRHFGSIRKPYVEEYKPVPFSRRFVRNLPGWYAQKHPDEDWAETFAVWMTPGLDWRAAYAGWPEALEKLEYCDRAMASCNARDPLVTATERDVDVSEISGSLEQYYGESEEPDEGWPPGLDGALQAIFEDFGTADDGGARGQASELILRLKRDLVRNVYRWTGHFPEPARNLVQHLAERAKALGQVYPADSEGAVTVAITALITTLAMNHVLRGNYAP